MTGLRLERTAANGREIDALADRYGGRVSVETLLSDLNRCGRRAWAPGRAVHHAATFDAVDRTDLRWWPQGVTTSGDAAPSGLVAGRRLVLVAWYAKNLPGDARGQGVRLTFFDVDSHRYRHALVVVPTLRDGVAGLEPLGAHAGGIVWCGSYLHVAATARGFHTVRVDDLLRVPDDVGGSETFGYRYLLPVRFSFRARSEAGVERLRYSFMSLDRAASPPELLVGEYAGARAGQSRRLVRFPLDPETLLPATGDDGVARPQPLGEGVAQMQGVVLAQGRLHVTSSRGRSRLGSVFTGPPSGVPASLRERRWATPMGPEDLAYWPQTDELVSVTEHPPARWIFTMRRSWFD